MQDVADAMSILANLSYGVEHGENAAKSSIAGRGAETVPYRRNDRTMRPDAHRGHEYARHFRFRSSSTSSHCVPSWRPQINFGAPKSALALLEKRLFAST